MATSLARLTLYALISSIETDLRDSLKRFACDAMTPAAFFSDELHKTLLVRAGSEESSEASSADSRFLLDYSDFGDLYSLGKRHARQFPEVLRDQLKALNSAFERLIATRNRVMHSRPLEFDDLARTTELSTILVRSGAFWPNLCETIEQLTQHPEFVLKLTIPAQPEPTNVLHNLPLADFDETGFIGRKQTLANLIRACEGPYPVITVVGEGGLGKTSLAIKAAFDILDSNTYRFDAIIFVTAKATQLTVNEISRIKGAITSSLGLMEVAVDALGGDRSDAINELKSLLNTFRILLIIDNLETVMDEHLRDVLEELPAESKILITTRIGLGAFEFPVQLQGLTDEEAVQLLRATADTRGCTRLTNANNERLATYCRRMRNNPLHIKWFVSAVQAGKRPEEVLADESVFLKFCMSNVFDQINEDARTVVKTLLSLGGSYTVAELSYLTEM